MSRPSDQDAGTPPRTDDELTGMLTGLRALLSAVQELILVVDAEGRYQRHLPTRYAGLTAGVEDVTGMSIDDFLRPDDCARVRRVMGETLAGAGPQRVEYPIQFDSTQHWYDAEISAISGLPGHTLWMV